MHYDTTVIITIISIAKSSTVFTFIYLIINNHHWMSMSGLFRQNNSNNHDFSNDMDDLRQQNRFLYE